MSLRARKKNTLWFYLLTMLLFLVLILGMIKSNGDQGGTGVTLIRESTEQTGLLDALSGHSRYPLAILLFQMLIVMLSARLCGRIASAIGQPRVIGEILAGIILGPSFFGNYFPGFHEWVFPEFSLGHLQLVSQVGLILFMFSIGMELDFSIWKEKTKEAVLISHASIFFPFALGVLMADLMYARYAPADVHFISFALFMGISMSITAFPVLARIVQERGLTKTRLGNLVLTCAAVDDVTAWCLLAAVIAFVKAGSMGSALYLIALSMAFIVVMIYVVRPFLQRIVFRNAGGYNMDQLTVGTVFVTLVASAWVTEVMGIHALFGAFIAGAILPETGGFRSQFIQKVGDTAVVLLLPLFFVSTGLRTQIALLGAPHLWAMTGLIILAAVIGKFAAGAVTARYVGESWKDSLSIGALMNTRGLMELIVLNIGFDLGILSPEVFTMMVIMALVTTLMTGPSLNLINRLFK